MSKADDNYKLLRTMLDERLKADKRLAAIADKIAKGKADFADTAKYTHIVSHHMGKVISENIGKITAPLGKEAVCKELLRDHYDLINGVFGEVQVSVDEKMGIHIKPVKPAYPTERVDTWAHSLEDPTVDQSVIERRAASGSENIGNSMHDDCVKENAKLHDKAGFDCYLVRDAGGGCCAWCAAIAGRYKYADAPDDVFKRHDHCTCTTTYECGRMRQDVWSKRTWQASDKELEQRKEISEASKPTVNTPEQAKELERQALEKNPVTKLTPEQAQELNERSKPTVHTPAEAQDIEAKALASIEGQSDFQSKPGKDDNAIADMAYINSQAYADKFKGKYENEQVENAVVSACRQIINNRNGTFYEEAYFIDARTGRTISYIKGKQKNGIEMSDELKKHLTNAPEKSIIMIHNHPNSTPPSTEDFVTAAGYKSCFEAISCGHNGDVYAFRDIYSAQGKELGTILKNGKETPYYEGTRDFYVAQAKYLKEHHSEIDAWNLAWKKTSETRGFFYEKR